MRWPAAAAGGRAIVSDCDFELRAVVPPSTTIDPTVGSGEPDTFAKPSGIRAPLAGEADAPAIALATRRPKAAKTAAIGRGRLPNMPAASADLSPPITAGHSTEVPLSSFQGPAPCDRLL
jgi:hypothetical protein